jgi:hypothetical protein
MTDLSQWTFLSSTTEGGSFSIAGVDVWKNSWTDTKEMIHVKDPLYQQDFTFHIYTISCGGKTVRFAAGEFSNGVWGFYAPMLPDK